MMKVTATQERGWVAQVPADVVPGKWRWSLLGPAPQTIDEDTGAGVQFIIDESIEANRGEYLVSVQRFDNTGGGIGDSQSSAPFVITQDVPTMIEVEIAGTVSVSIEKG